MTAIPPSSLMPLLKASASALSSASSASTAAMPA
eukprot:CAMPEP_0115704166 /NCGR_PEP_ID=MMETSP0272-20121206/69508_1 /TAXON_ID=71861 /ORGANISM="Scrippsiella trochoidea, Strain CCMP3099" /LENGTH=33 /DNA_ID= /DNA_START= /DNA_END= /DNA_ORIENTATION=